MYRIGWAAENAAQPVKDDDWRKIARRRPE
jgi:hypothetical protein